MTELTVSSTEIPKLQQTSTEASLGVLQRLKLSIANLTPSLTGVEQAMPTVGHIVPDTPTKAVIAGALAGYVSALGLISR